MRILIANDDGVTAPGIAALYDALADHADCVVIAPDQDKSGASSSLTLDRPLHPQRLDNGFISLNGTPTDCVHLGLNGLLEELPDMVVSGINLGANLGDDVLYSGTVAAAIEGRFLKGPAFAFSLVSRLTDNLPTAMHFARLLVSAHERLAVPPRTVLNVNIPNLPLDRDPTDPPRAPRPCRRTGEGGQSARQGRLLDRRGRRCRGWRAGDGFPRGHARLRVDHSVAAGPYLPRSLRRPRRVAGRTDVMSEDLHRRGIGMTSQRTRERLIQRLYEEGLSNAHVLEVIRRTPRHLFVDEALSHRAYEDTALPIGHNQTISQPFMVARMTELLLAAGPLDKVMEIGTGSGYQTAVLAQLVERVFSVERIQALQDKAKERLAELNLRNVVFRWGDGWEGWSALAPYNGIIVTAAATEVPQSLLDQLAPGGRLVIPVGGGEVQQLMLIVRTEDGFSRQVLDSVRFVPLLNGPIA